VKPDWLRFIFLYSPDFGSVFALLALRRFISNTRASARAKPRVLPLPLADRAAVVPNSEAGAGMAALIIEWVARGCSGLAAARIGVDWVRLTEK
jgi:hypothetical protein